MSRCYKCLVSLNIPTAYGLHPQCFEDWFQCPSNTPFEGLTPHNATTGGDTNIQSSFFHGKFKKYTAELNGKKYVLKVTQNDYPHLPQVEYVSNQIAKSLKLRIPEFYFIQLEGQDCFISRHFLDGTRWQKLTHIYHYLRRGSELDVENLREIIFTTTNKPQDVDLFYQTILFDSLIGNHDRHGRNLGILSKGKVNRLSPIYDNPSYIGIEDMLGTDLNPRGKIFTKSSNKPTMKDYVIELKRLKAEKALKVFHRRCSLKNIENILMKSVLKEKVREAMMKLIKKRYEEFAKNF